MIAGTDPMILVYGGILCLLVGSLTGSLFRMVFLLMLLRRLAYIAIPFGLGAGIASWLGFGF